MATLYLHSVCGTGRTPGIEKRDTNNGLAWPWSMFTSGSSDQSGDGGSAVGAAGGVNYKIWGDDTCPDTAALIYEG